MICRVGEQCDNKRWAARAALLAMWFVFCAASSAQTSRPATVGQFDNRPLQKSTGNAPTSRQAGVVPNKSQDLFDTGRVFLALLIVLGLIFVLRYVGKRYFPNIAGGSASGIVRVLSRSSVTPKQHVLLVQVGKRVLVVSDNGTQMNSLSEITDPDEVAMLIGQATSSPTISKKKFGTVFGKAQDSFNDVPESDSAVAENEEPVEPADESLASTRGEINGLMEKVRVLAKQLGRQ